MLDLKFIRENADRVKAALIQRLVEGDIDRLLALDSERRTLIGEAEELKHRRNEVSRDIGAQKKAGRDALPELEEMKGVSRRIHLLDEMIRQIDAELSELLARVPNVPEEDVPVGPDERCAVEISSWGRLPEFDFQPRHHLELGEALGLFDFARGARIAGSQFPLFTGAGARLNRALVNLMLDLHTSAHGYTEVSPPFLSSRSSMFGTGQLPKMEDDMYRVEADDLFLIPTAEVSVTNIHREEIVPGELLPLRYVAYSPCFRREAGSYGKETRGLIRLHQFDKVELVQFVRPENSVAAHRELLGHAEAVLQLLGLPYRVRELPTGDLSFAAARCYDIEVWAPGQGEWLECSSCSLFRDFQARRAGIRYRDRDGRPDFAHTLNGSGLALPRTVVAILENFQQPDGTVVLPEALHPHMGGLTALSPKA